MTAYYLAPSLAVLRAEIDARWPRRDKASDGWIGDTAHQASKSDHNPNERGSVNALDIDRDGIDVAEVIAAVERHPSTHYWIYQRQIADRDDGWRRRPYTGPNPHDKHLHVSIRQSRTAEQDRRPWGLEDTVTKDDIKAAVRELLAEPLPYGAKGPADRLAAKGWSKKLSILGQLAYVMEHAVDGAPSGELAAIRAQLTELTGKDWTDETAVVAGVLAGLGPDRLAQALTAAGLTPEAIAAAVPADMARQVVDELTTRLRE
ncbi:hypothetical protein ACH4T9_20000 [Micromonospora sp. NPDC020750]|uniref:hypothetical protein n=1 Tax=unclassified Micromonospora TaxID=2617518 RepID=UPI00378C0971